VTAPASVTDSDETEEAATSNNNEPVFIPVDPQLARARDGAEPTTPPEWQAGEWAEGDGRPGAAEARQALADLRERAGGACRAAARGPRAWPLFTRRHPSVLEVFDAGRNVAAWDSESLLVRWPARVLITADALWELGCMTARVWFRTRITWTITVLAVIAWLAWGR
jgi:hypothetical protein